MNSRKQTFLNRMEMPAGWQLAALGDLVDREAPICYGILKPGEHTPDGIPFLRVTDYVNGGLTLQTLMRTSKQIDSQYARSKLSKGDIVMSIRGSTGHVIVVPEWLHGANITQDSARIRVGSSTLRSFLQHALCGPYAHRQVVLNTIGQAVRGINIAQVRKLRIPLPPLPEQKKIAEILSTWDRAIEQARNLIDAKQRLKKGLMQKLLTGKVRFPEFGKGVGSGGGVPKGWETKKLRDLFAERNESAPHLPLLSITGDRGVIPRDEVERKDTSNADKAKYKRIVPGDIGYNTMRMWQGVSAVSDHLGIVSPAYTICRPKKGTRVEFFGHLFKFPPMVNLFHRYSQGLVSDTLNLKFHHFGQIECAVPPPMEQERISEVLSICTRELDKLRKKMVSLESQKKALMQQLLTGKIRVRVDGKG